MRNLILLILLIPCLAFSQNLSINNTNVRWTFPEPVSVSENCHVSGDGKYSVVGWNFSNLRASLFNNQSSTPVWEFPVSAETFVTYTSISDTAGAVGVSAYHNISLLGHENNIAFYNYDVTQVLDSGIAGPLDIASDGRFFVCSIMRPDSAIILGFNTLSLIPDWTQRIAPNIMSGGAEIQGIKLSGNDSVVIVNTFAEVFVIRTYTGQLLHRAAINPASPDIGSQATQGINGDGSVIAVINSTGLLTVKQWNGSGYQNLWSNQEPPGQSQSVYSAVDITYDGEYIAAGTLNFLSSDNYDGKVRVFRKSGNGIPMWSYEGCGDKVTSVSFSRSGNILSASSWGNRSVTTPTEDLYIFKTFLGGTPIFKVNSPGSFFYCGTSSDGRTVVASGKAVHARQSGFGGLVYNIDVDTTDIPSSVTSVNNGAVEDYKLHQNFPNPFNPTTKIRFEVPSNNGLMANVRLSVYNSLGEEVIVLLNEKLSSGIYETDFNGGDFSSGIYFYRLDSENFTQSRSMILLK